MPAVLNEFVGDGVQRTYNLSMEGGYLERGFVKFYTRSPDTLLDWTPLTNNAVTWTGDFSIQLQTAIQPGTVLVVFRETPLSPLVDFQNSSRITERNLDIGITQPLHKVAELTDLVDRATTVASVALEDSADALALVTTAEQAALSAAAQVQEARDFAEAADIKAADAKAFSEAADLRASAAAADAATAASDSASSLAIANSANSTAGTALGASASATATANQALSTAAATTSVANAAVATANSAETTANSAESLANDAVTASALAVGVATDASGVAEEAITIAQAVADAGVVTFKGRSGFVVPETGDYTPAMVGLGNVNNTSDSGKPVSTAQLAALNNKVDKVAGKVLSSNDFTNAERVKLSNVAENASANSSDAVLLARPNHTGPLNWAWSVRGGTANAITLTPTFTRTAYAAGDEFRFRATATNTGAVTINVNGLGAKTAVTVTGVALPAGYIRTGVDTVCVYDGTRFVVQRDMERGNNANGAYVKYADGTQMCWGNVDMPNTTPLATTQWTYPSAFSNVPVGVVTPRIVVGGSGSATAVGELSRNGLYYSVHATNMQLSSYHYQTPQTNPVGLSITVQGVWYE